MIDIFVTIALRIFDYFISQNAPMTIAIVIGCGSLYLYLNKRERMILEPIEQSKYAADLMKLQMNMLDDSLDRLHSVLYSIYRAVRKRMMEEDGDDKARDNLEYDTFVFMHSLQLWGVQGAIKNEVRRFFRENHLASMDEDKFNAYLTFRTDQMWTKLIQVIDEYWFSGMVRPNRSDLYDIHEKERDRIMSVIRDILTAGRKIAIEYAKDHKRYEG
jgi:hypothetical protein